MTKHILLLLLLFTLSIKAQKKVWALKECVSRALSKNISVQQNELSLRLAKKDVEIAKGNFLPNFSGTSNAGFNSGLSPNETGVLSNTINLNSSFGLSSSGNIFNGYRNTNTYRQAKLGVESSILDLKKIENDVSLLVINGYLNVLFAKENLTASEFQYEISKNQIKAAEERFKSGAIAKGEFLNTQSSAMANQQTVVTQKNALDLALLNLAQLLQVPVEDFDVLPIEAELSQVILYKNSDYVYQKSLTTMPEIKRANLAVDNANFDIEISKSSYLPTLSYSLSARTSYFHQFNNLLPNQTNDDFANQFLDRLQLGVAVSLNVPIFNRFQTKNNIAKSKINKELSKVRLQNEKLNLKQTIEQAFLDVKAASKSYEAAKISLEAQKEAFKNAQERYNHDAMTLFDFDQVRTRLVNVESTLSRSKYDYIFKTKVLEFYSGELNLD